MFRYFWFAVTGLALTLPIFSPPCRACLKLQEYGHVVVVVAVNDGVSIEDNLMLSLQAERPFLTGFIGKASVVGSVPGNYDLFPARIRARNIHFRSFVGASVGATGLPEGEGSIDRQDYETGHLKYPRCAMLGFFLCIVGVAGLYFFWAKLYEDFATNMHVARDSTFLILSVCAFWGSFGLIGHAFGLL